LGIIIAALVGGRGLGVGCMTLLGPPALGPPAASGRSSPHSAVVQSTAVSS
jgi:hypothetical protein